MPSFLGTERTGAGARGLTKVTEAQQEWPLPGPSGPSRHPLPPVGSSRADGRSLSPGPDSPAPAQPPLSHGPLVPRARVPGQALRTAGHH